MSKNNKPVVIGLTPVLEKNKVVKTQEIDFIGRGFRTIEEANEFVNTEIFARLGKADQAEYINWLNK